MRFRKFTPSVPSWSRIGKRGAPCVHPRVPWKVRCSNRWKSCPGKGRPGRVAIPAAMEVTKWSKPGRHKTASGRLQVGRL